MKAGVIKLGSRISYGGRDTSGGNGETRSVINILHTGGWEVHVFTKISDKDNLVENICWHDILEDFEWINDFDLDALIVLNGNVNFFGGAEDRSQILNYHLINTFKGDVYYVLCDPALQLKQIWPSVDKKPWGSKYERKNIEITRNDIHYIAQPFNVNMLHKEILPKNGIGVSKVTHFPFEKFPCLNDIIPAKDISELEVDLSYGGTMRGGKREKKMIEFYFGYSPHINVEMFGKIELEDFKKYGTHRPPQFSGTVKYDDFLPKMNNALSTVVIGDPLYEKLDDLNQRLYECIWANVVTFVDADFDKQKRAYGHDVDLADFLYVKNRKDVEERIKLLKLDSDLRDAILQSQIKAVDFDKHKYSHQLTRIIKGA